MKALTKRRMDASASARDAASLDALESLLVESGKIEVSPFEGPLEVGIPLFDHLLQLHVLGDPRSSLLGRFVGPEAAESNEIERQSGGERRCRADEEDAAEETAKPPLGIQFHLEGYRVARKLDS